MRTGGALFGVPLSNYLGWFIVGALSIGGFVLGGKSRSTGWPAAGGALYYGVLAFNLGVPWWIGESTLFPSASCCTFPSASSYGAGML